MRRYLPYVLAGIFVAIAVALTGLGLLALTPALYRQWTKRQSGSIEKSEA
jgi:hypothetical protein